MHYCWYFYLVCFWENNYFVFTLKAAHYIPDDDDYHMLVAICYIKLNEYDNAKGILEVDSNFSD